MSLRRGLTTFGTSLFSSPQYLRLGSWSRCIHQLSGRRITCERPHSAAKRQRTFPYSSKRARERPTNTINITISHERIAELSREILHTFRENEVLATAMVHESLLSEPSEHEVFAEIQPGVVQRITQDNEKLELLGDKVLGLLMVEHLMKENPTFDKGQLMQIFSYTVSNKDLSRYCKSLHLDSFLITANNVHRSSKPGNFFEALLGALYTDGGLPAASRFFSERVTHLLFLRDGDSKRLLQEHLIASGLPGNDLNRVLKYVPVSEIQRAGIQSFTQAIHLLGRRFSIGTAPTRTQADQIAAARLLASLKKRNSTACVLNRLAKNVWPIL